MANFVYGCGREFRKSLKEYLLSEDIEKIKKITGDNLDKWYVALVNDGVYVINIETEEIYDWDCTVESLKKYFEAIYETAS